MSDGTKIEWTDATLNVVNGCSVVSPGCTNCYAMRSGGRNLPHHPATGLTMPSMAGHVWTGEVRFNDAALLLPLRWKRPRKIFWNAHGDLFHENVPDEWIDRCFAVMGLTPHHVHQVLTKRPGRMRDYLLADRRDLMNSHAGTMMHWNDMPSAEWPLPNVWLGTSVEDQERADERIPVLLAAPAAVRWLSMEPLLGPVDLRRFGMDVHHHPNNDVASPVTQAIVRAAKRKIGVNSPDWIVVGGESGPGARPMHPDWARSLRDQCAAAGVPFLFKQWGNWLPVDAGHPELVGPGFGAFDNCKVNEAGNATHVRVGKKAAGRLLDGVQHDGYPA